jgi:hypothetical protein
MAAPLTVTAEDVIAYLKKRGFKLTLADREFIRERIGTALQSAAEWQSNGCDCGQVACPICGG